MTIENEGGVKDKYNYVYFGFYLYGLGGLMPWNFYITPENYWNHKLSTNFSQNGTLLPEQNWMQNFWQNFLSILCTGIVFVMSLLMQCRPKSWTKECMITVGIGASVLFFIATALMGVFDSTEWVTVFFWVNLAIGTTLSAFTAIVQNMGMAMAGALGDKYVQALCSGQGVAGIFAAIAYIINLWAAGSASVAGVSFFATAAVVGFVALCNHFGVIRNKFYRSQTNPIIVDVAQPLLQNDDEIHSISECEQDRLSSAEILKICAPDIYAVFITLMVTLSVFPGVTASVRSTSTNDAFCDMWFVPVCTFLIYNIGDTFGRFLTSLVQLPAKESTCQLYFWSTCRVIFIVIFPLCNIPRSPDASIPNLITQDWLYAILILLFSVSNGYLTTLGFQYAPGRLESKAAKAQAEELVFIGLTSGLIIGSTLSFGVKAVTLYA